MPFGIGATELLIVGIIAVILFGNRLPSVARSLGKSFNEFKKGLREFEDEVRTSVYSEPAGRVTYHDTEKPATPPAEMAATAADQPAAESHAQ